MASFVTLPGSTGQGVVTVQAGSGDHEFIAQIIANTILWASVGGSGAPGGVPDLNPPVNVTINGGSPTTAPTAPNGPKSDNILYMYGTGGGDFTIPGGYQYVVDLMTGPETITGNNVQVISYDPAHTTFNLGGNSSVAADPATDNDVVSVVAGNFNIATGDGNDTISLTGSGTIDGGLGTNLLIAAPTGSGSNGIRVQSEGTSDTVLISNGATETFGSTGGAAATVVSHGNDVYISAGADTVYAQILGNDATISGNGALLEASLGGSYAKVFGGTGAMSIQDSGSYDSIAAFGASAVSVNAFGSSAEIFGGSGSMFATLTGTSGQGDNKLFAGTGSTDVTMGGAYNEVVGYAGNLMVTDWGTADTIAAFGAGSIHGSIVTVIGAGQNGWMSVGSGNSVVSIGGGVPSLGGGNEKNDTLFSAAGNTTVTLGDTFGGASGGTGNVVWGGYDSLTSGSLTVTVANISEPTNDQIRAWGASSANVSLEGSGAVVYGGFHSLTAAISNIDDTVVGGSGGTYVSIDNLSGATNNLVLGGTGSLTVNDQGQADTIATFGATSNVTVGGRFDRLLDGSGSVNASISGSDDTVDGGTGPATINASSGVVIFSYTGPLSFVGGAGTASILGSPSGTEAMTVGSGGAVLWTGSGTSSLNGNQATIVGGTGATTTVVGGAFSQVYFSSVGTGSVGSLYFTAGAGNETLNASTSHTNNFYAAGADSTAGNSIVGGSGDDTFTGGSGSDSFVGGSGSDAFVFFESVTSGNAGGAHDYITDWTSNDSLFLIGYDTTQGQSANTLMANATTSNNSLTITLSDNTQITFVNETDKSAFNGKIYYT